MAKKTNKNLVFQTKKERKSGQMKKFIAVLVAFVAVFGSLSVLYLMKYYNFDVDKMLGEEETTAEATAAAVSTVIPEESSSTYLFFSAPSDKSRVNFAVAVRITVPDCTVEICPLNSSAIVHYGGEETTLARAYAAGGTKALVQACSELCGAEIDRFAGSTDETFRQTVYDVGYSGGFKVNVAEQIEYRSADYNLILAKGEQSLKGDSLLKYLRYLFSVESNGEELAKAFESIFSQIFANESSADAAKLYASLVNTLETDVSRFDFSHSSAGIDMLLNGKAKYFFRESLSKG